MKRAKESDIGIRVSGRMFLPGEGIRTSTEVIRHSKGFGRWIYCKYCCKNVRPALGGINQIVCYNCGAGLSPDFFRRESLEQYWKAKSPKEVEAIFERDRNSDEAKEWLRQIEIRDALKQLDKQ